MSTGERDCALPSESACHGSTTPSCVAHRLGVTASMTECDLLDEGAASAYLGGVPEGTMRQWRYRGKGPAYVKLGRHVRYRRSDLDAFVARQRVDPQ